MKKFLLLSLSSFAISASANFTQDYQKLVDQLTPKINACNTHINDVVRKSVIDTNKKGKGSPHYVFVKDEKKANELLNQFDINKLLISEEYELSTYVLKDCSDENLKVAGELSKNAPSCLNNIMLEYNYVRALTTAWKNYSWAPGTKEKAKEVANLYLKHFFSQDKVLLPQLMGLALAKLMATNGMLDKILLKQINEASVHGEVLSKMLHDELRKDQKAEANTCERFRISREREDKTAFALNAEIKNILKY
jgi:hypothetical protein